MPNQKKFRELYQKADLTQNEVAQLIARQTMRPCSIRTIRAWLATPGLTSARPCPDWAVLTLSEAIQQGSPEIKAVLALERAAQHVESSGLSARKTATSRIREECPDCHGTGLYSGICEAKNEAVICGGCGGQGWRWYGFTEFSQRKRKRGIKIIRRQGKAGEKMTYAEFEKRFPVKTGERSK